jgi:energy-converting hydrogenase B subunit D
MIEAILVLLLVLGFFALHFRDLVNAVICLAVFSLLNALLFYLLHAPDVAIAEAAVGAGVSTVIFVWAVARTQRRQP